jgi:hypothetical protein
VWASPGEPRPPASEPSRDVCPSDPRAAWSSTEAEVFGEPKNKARRIAGLILDRHLLHGPQAERRDCALDAGPAPVRGWGRREKGESGTRKKMV